MEVGEEVIVTPHALGSKGEAIAKHKGLVIFIYGGALPEEEVEVRIIKVKKNYAQAELLKVRSASPDRVEPPCPYFGKCGGCQIQNWNYARQLVYKRQKVVDALERIGHFTNLAVADCVPSPTEYHYRNKVQLPVVGGEVGLYAAQSHDVVPIERCLIHCELGEEVFSKVKEFTFEGLRHILIKSSGESLVVFITRKRVVTEELAEKVMATCPEVVGVVENINQREDNVILGTGYRLVRGRDWIEEELLGCRFRISPHAFFQVNSQQAERLYSKVIELAGVNESTSVLDAYCGVGTLAILLSQKAGRVLGIECVEGAVEDARKNAELNGSTNCEFMVGRVEKLIGGIDDCDVVVVNPPRKGCDGVVLESLLGRLPEKIIYVSCNPATLARDLEILSRSYNLDSVVPFDMFPQTTHVETVVRLIKL